MTESQQLIMDRCRELGLPILGPTDPMFGEGVVVSLGLLNKRLAPLENEGYSLCPLGTKAVEVTRARGIMDQKTYGMADSLKVSPEESE